MIVKCLGKAYFLVKFMLFISFIFPKKDPSNKKTSQLSISIIFPKGPINPSTFIAIPPQRGLKVGNTINLISFDSGYLFINDF